jgi:hypothetical protein
MLLNCSSADPKFSAISVAMTSGGGQVFCVFEVFHFEPENVKIGLSCSLIVPWAHNLQ